MQSFIAATVIAFIGATSALPAKGLSARAPGDVTFFTGENYTGESTPVSIPFNECQKIPAAVLGNVGSLKVDVGALCRITYTEDSCTAHGDAFVDPATNAPTLHHFQDPATGEIIDAGSKLTSILCQECTACTA